ncbi:MAG: hypothetical protein CUN55_15370, partial [Phototrophicales bacterium]
LELIHTQAIYTYRNALKLEGDTEEKADDYWKQAIAHWVTVIVNDLFWGIWRDYRSEVVGEISDEILAEVREEMYQRLKNDFRDFRLKYIKDGLEEQKTRHENYEVLLVREYQAATEMLNVMKENPQLCQQLAIACGPLQLEYWRAYPEAGTQIAEAKNLANHSPKLKSYLGRLGFYHTMVFDLKRYDSARDELTERMNETQVLMVEVLIARGHELAAKEQYREAIETLEHAARYRVEYDRVVALLVEKTVVYVKQMPRSKATIESALDLMTRLRVQHNIGEKSFLTELAQLYCLQGIEYHKAGQFNQALETLRNTLELDPNNLDARNYFIDSLVAYAGELATRGEYDKAIDLLNEATEWDVNQASKYIAEGAKIFAARGRKYFGDANMAATNYQTIDAIRNYLLAWEDYSTVIEYLPYDYEAQDIYRKLQSLVGRIKHLID